MTNGGEQTYLAYAGALAEQVWSQYDEWLERSRKAALANGNYHPLGYLAHLAAIEAVRHAAGGPRLHAGRARQALLDLGASGEQLLAATGPQVQAGAESLPVPDNLFNLSEYLRAVHVLERSGCLDDELRATARRHAAAAIEPIFSVQDWGAHNRAAHRAVNLELAAQLFPEHPQSRQWSAMSRVLMEDSWGKWSIEDASIYLPIWLNALFAYQQLTDREGLFELPMTRYYCDYLVRLLNPRGAVTDFGDGGWGDGWARIVACLEKGAAVYRCSGMKYAAQTVFRHMSALDVKASGRSLRMASALLDAYFWADGTVPARVPTHGSGDVLDDVIGKKLVFRSGWEEQATFLLLNYRDEGDYGYPARQYLRQTIRADMEKMHHGHADENSIVSLIAGGSILLHDAGYRDALNDTTGAYRADFYHNSVIVRRGRPQPGQSFLQFCHNDGTYREARSQKIHFASFRHLEMSRTRVEQPYYGTVWDRSVCYFRQEQVFVIVDTVQVQEDGEYTFGPLYYGGYAEETVPGGFLSGYDTIGTNEDWRGKVGNPGDTSLFVYFPLADGRRTDTDRIRRSYVEEIGIGHYFSGQLRKGDIVPFVTVLHPVASAAGFDPAAWAARWSVRADERGLSTAVEWRKDDGLHVIGIKNELTHGVSDPSRRPAYDFGHGRLDYGPVATDADFVHVFLRGKSADYGFVNGTRVDVNGRTACAVNPCPYKQLDLSWREGVSSRSRWEDRFEWE